MAEAKSTLRASAGWARRMRRLFEAFAPAAVWLVAIAAAGYLYSKRSMTGTITGYAEVRPVTVAHLEPGMVRELRAQLHQLVEPGELLAKMDDRDDRLELSTITTDLKRLQGEVKAERTRLNLEQAGVELDTDDLSRRLLVDREAAHIQYLVQLVERAGDQATLDGTLVEYGILERLFEDEQANFREVNLLKTQVDALRARILKNDEALKRMKKAFEEADQRWFTFNDRQQEPVDYESVLTPIRMAADVREKEIHELIFRIDQHALRAPVRGQITAVLVEPGDRVLAGEPLITISPTATDRVVAYLPEDKTRIVYLGEPVRVYPLAGGVGGRQGVPGTVLSVADSVTEAPLRFRKVPNWPVWGREVVVALADDMTLMPGEAVSLRFDE